MRQSAAPVLEALAAARRRPLAGFGAPGHGGGRGASTDVVRLIGRKAFEADLLTPKGLDDRLETGQVLQRANALAAKAWNADLCRFGTGGSTQNLHCVLAAVAKPGDKVLMAANCHKAERAAAVFAGLNSVAVPVATDPITSLEHGPSVAALEAALDAHPDTKAVLVVSPSYFGFTCDVGRLAVLCHERGVPLVVDGAWGAAFGFHPELPANPLTLGADAVVVSVHKTMGALGQGSALLARGDRIDPQRLALAYELFETTSPSVPILASLDAARRAHALHGRRLWSRVLHLARTARTALAAIEGVQVVGRERLDGDGAFDLDETKIVLDLSRLGISIYEADDWLVSHHGVSLGFSDMHHALAIFSVGVTRRQAKRLVRSVEALAAQARRRSSSFQRPTASAPRYQDLTETVAMPAADAFAAETELITYEHAAGRVAAEIIAPAPPGVPRLMPGQLITSTHVAFLTAHHNGGMFVLDPTDPKQRKIRVVKR